jgi:hypothetical protein
MTAEALVARLPSARRNPRGWLAKCPAHDDRAPSLSISSGADGRVLLKCFSGCEVDRIVAALGVQTRDLFAPRDNQRFSAPRARRLPTQAEIRAALEREVKAFKNRSGIDESELLLSSEINEIRSRVAARFGVTLHPIPRRLWEGAYGGRERDPAWPAAFERAWSELWFERGMQPPHTLAERAKEGRELRPAIRIIVEQRAAEIHAFVARGKKLYGRSA